MPFFGHDLGGGSAIAYFLGTGVLDVVVPMSIVHIHSRYHPLSIGIFDHTVTPQDCVNKINLESQGGATDLPTKISHKEWI